MLLATTGDDSRKRWTVEEVAESLSLALLLSESDWDADEEELWTRFCFFLSPPAGSRACRGVGLRLSGAGDDLSFLVVVVVLLLAFAGARGAAGRVGGGGLGLGSGTTFLCCTTVRVTTVATLTLRDAVEELTRVAAGAAGVVVEAAVGLAAGLLLLADELNMV